MISIYTGKTQIFLQSTVEISQTDTLVLDFLQDSDLQARLHIILLGLN